ncbi:MAG: MBL fold metallo-hydrolase [Clostridia bacterium]
MKNQINKISFKVRVVVFLSISVLLLFSLFFSKPIENFINAIPSSPESEVGGAGLFVHVINVGQGDAIVVEFTNGSVMLVDSGLDTKESKQILLNYLNIQIFKDLNNSKPDSEKVIDSFVITHAHDDHIGGAPEVFDNFLVKNFYRPNVKTQSEKTSTTPQNNVCTSLLYAKTIQKANAEQGCTNFYNKSGLSLKEGVAKIDFLSPISASYANPNNYSPIMIIEYMSKKIMLTGDAESLVEREVLNKYKNELQVDVLKLGHHGSKTSTCENFLYATSPQYVVISSGRGYGHPSPETLTNLKNAGVADNKIFKTYENGNIVFAVYSSGTLVATANYNPTTPQMYVHYWYIVVFGISALFVVLIIPGQKKVKQI